MIFGWLKKRRRRRIRNEPFPSEWVEVLERNVFFYAGLSDAERAKLRSDLQVFVAEKNWEGCGGFVITDEARVTIAAQACLLVLGFDDELYDLVQSILVYPDAYVAPDQTITKGGVVLEGESYREGEASYRGPVILAWTDALAGGRRQAGGDNLVLHEFAHQLDMQNGHEVDGTPPLPTASDYQQWQRVIGREFARLQHDCERDRPTLLDCYGATDLGEFFAVATECFFVSPREMARRHHGLYDLFRRYYRQDPARRC